ncbi:hypothetical protein [Streptomyces sp. 6N106]|uniref:hypothetical protein n=1 Tax=Streptomyces sp. 6N106 TaxID=3457418 RepID=UPI003FD13D47
MATMWEYGSLRFSHCGWAWLGPSGEPKEWPEAAELTVLNELGRQGWELVIAPTSTQTGSRYF